nr:histidinol-phosphate transaminase [Planococcus salinarum]
MSEAFLEQGDEIIVPSPSFSEYDFGAHIMGAVVTPVSFDEGFEYNIDKLVDAVTDKTKIIYICSPNNPTGTYISRGQMEELVEKLTDVLVVFDGAYSQFADEEDYTDGLEFVAAGHPVIALQTFSKIYGIAGVRVGFGIASEEIITSILKVKEPFNVNTLAQIAAAAAITDTDHVEASFNANLKGRDFLYTSFEKLGLAYTETTANFILVQVGPDGEDVYGQLMAHGIIVRYGKTWGLPEHIRVTIGTEEENELFIKTLTGILTPLK